MYLIDVSNFYSNLSSSELDGFKKDNFGVLKNL